MKLDGRLKAYTEFTLTEPKALELEFEVIRNRGYAECVEEIERGMCSVAAPLSKTGAGTQMSIGATGSVRVFKQAFREDIGNELIQLAMTLSERLAWNDQAVA